MEFNRCRAYCQVKSVHAQWRQHKRRSRERIKNYTHRTRNKKLEGRVNRKYGRQFQTVSGNSSTLTQNKKTQLNIVLKGLREK